MGRYFEEFAVGDIFTTGTRVITREDILAFAILTGDTNPLHTDTEFMKDSQFGDVIAHGLFVVSVAIGLIAETGIMQGTTIALSQADSRLLAPTLPGDELHADFEIVALRPSRKLDRGVMDRVIRVVNQHGQTVAETRTVSIMRRQPTQ